MNSALTSSIGGVAMSLLFAYVPGLKAWFGQQDGTRKRAVMAGTLLLVALAAFGLACWPAAARLVAMTCSEAGLPELAGAFIAALVANQATYSLAVRPASGKVQS
jgi:hypothetical protein